MKNNKIIFLIPFAGGSFYSMKGLEDKLIGVDTLALELPGRGKRVNEKLSNSLDVIINDLFLKIIDIIEDYEEYFIFGHSLGALLGYLVVIKIINIKNRYPTHLFVSGRGGPSKEKDNEKTYLLPSKEFRKRLKEFGGVPEEVLKEEDLMTFFEPILRADFSINDSFNYKKTQSYDIPITCFYGSNEGITLEEMRLWEKETNCSITIIKFTGDHFFIFNFWDDIARIIMNRIDS